MRYWSLLFLIVASCAPGVDEGAAPAAEAMAAREGAAVPLSRIYVARQAQAKLEGPQARFAGRFGVRNNCLVFEGAGAIYLPLLAPATPVTVFSDRVEIGDRAHLFSQEAVIVGGAMEAEAAAMLVEKPPPTCRWPLLRTSGVQSAGG